MIRLFEWFKDVFGAQPLPMSLPVTTPENTEIHYHLVTGWRWPSFSPKEISCKGTGLILLNYDALDKLQAFRDIVDRAVILNSAYRSEAHNKAVGGAPNSYHRLGKAFDVRITPSLTRDTIKNTARIVGFKGIGDYQNFVHIDTGRQRYWDDRT